MGLETWLDKRRLKKLYAQEEQLNRACVELEKEIRSLNASGGLNKVGPKSNKEDRSRFLRLSVLKSDLVSMRKKLDAVRVEINFLYNKLK